MWANDPTCAEPVIRRLTRPQIPPELARRGWRLHHGPYGWQCLRAGQMTQVYDCAGLALDAALRAEGASERKGKMDREWYVLLRKMRST